MITTTDGRSIVYAVFHGDGYECKTLMGVFSTEEKAEAFAGPLRDAELARVFGRDGTHRVRRGWWPGYVSVESLELDSATGE